MARPERRRGKIDQLTGLRGVALDALPASVDSWRIPAWLLGILLIAVPSQALALWRVFVGLPAGSRPAMLDSIIFEYIGWFLTQGGRLYLDVWELKPPLPYEVAAGVSLLAGGDPSLAHWVHLVLTAAAAVGAAVVAGALVADRTGDGAAAFAAGVSLYVLPAYHWRAAFGFKPKYFVALFALLALYLALRDRPLGAGIMAGAATGFWQLAVLVPALVAGVAYDRGGRRSLGRVAAGTAGVLLLSVLPVVYWGALEAMATETVLVPLLVQESPAIGGRLQLAARLFGGSLPVAVFGTIGVAAGLRWRLRATWWLGGATAWFGAIALVIDLDGPPDLFPLMAFLAVGVGILLGLEDGRQRPAALLIATLAIVSVVTLGGFGLGGPTLHEPEPLAYEPDRTLKPPYSLDEQSHLYWHRDRPTTCRVFLGRTQRRLVDLTDQSIVQETCGAAGPVVDALLARWFGG